MFRGPGASRAFWYEIAAVLTAKAIALSLIYLIFFASPPALPDAAHHLFAWGASK
jgi:hypothetical protein